MINLDIPVAAAVVSGNDGWKVEYVNDEFVRLMGYENRETTGIVQEELIYGKDMSLYEETLEQVVQKKNPVSQELRVKKTDGSLLWVEIRCSFFMYQNVTPYLVVLFWDIDRKKKEELQQEFLNQKYELMEKISREYPFDLDVKNWTMLRTHRLMELRGDYEAEDVYYPVDEEVMELYPPDREPFLEALRKASREETEGSIDTRFRISREDEEPKYLWFRTYYKSVKNAEGNIERIIGRCFDIDMDKTLQDEVRRDPLTKLLNKIEVQREVDAFLTGKPEGVHILLLLDIDNFKGINDNFGHTFGDTVITDVASLIDGQFRTNDLVGRVGGDEFLVFMKNTTLETAEEKAQTLCRILSKEYTGANVQYHISISIGIAVFGEHGDNYRELFEKADHAMYRAKKSGKNGYEIARQTDVGPIHSEMKAIEERRSIGEKENEFLAFAVSLMAHAKDLDGSLNMLLKRIAERYKLDFVAVFENDHPDKMMTMTNCYAPDYDFYDKSIFPRINAKIENLMPGDFVILDSEEVEEVSSLEQYLKSVSKVDMERTFTSVIGKYEYFGKHAGEVIYLSFEKGKVWQKSELEMFQELTRMMAIFVSLRYRVDESQAEIRNIKNRDQLTNLYNQETFRKAVKAILQQANPEKIYALEYLDINNFGYVNENYGYQVGDSVLTMFAEDIRGQAYFCAGGRLYSDFFLILVEDDSTEAMLEHLRGRNKRFSNMQNHQYPNSGMGVTAGVYVLEDTKMDVEQAVENANLAWKNAKNLGRMDIVLYDESLRSERAKEQRVVGEFFEALYRDDFCMYLQPKFLLGERTVYGAEALARWKRPDGQILPPTDFIESLEKIGYITELDFYIYEEVLKTLDKWDRQHRRKIVISTNFSGKHFDTDGEEFLNRIQHILSKYSVPPKYIEIEVTEGVLVQNLDVLKKCMNRLREIGFRVAIDDFGTGFSSLSVLADMPSDVVKMDKSFIEQDMSEQQKNLLYEIGRMVRILHKDIIIEGVETEEQERFLEQGGFTCGQGYLCSCPISIGEFERLYL